MSDWSDVITAAVGGGATEAARAQQFYAGNDTKRELAELRNMIAQVAESGRNTRATQADTTKNKLGELSHEDRAAALKQKTDATLDSSNRGWTKLQHDDEHWWQGDNTRRRAQDQTEGRFWGGTLPFNYDALETRDTTTRLGQTMGLEGRKYAADSAYNASTENAATAADTASKSRRAHTVAEFLKLGAKDSFMGAAVDPKIYAKQFDELYNNPEALTAARLDRLEAGGDAGDDDLAAAAAAAPASRATVPVAGRRTPPPAVAGLPSPGAAAAGPAGASPAAGAAPVAPRAAVPAPVPPKVAAKTVTTDELQRLAARRGTTVEAERARAIAAGYAVVR